MMETEDKETQLEEIEVDLIVIGSGPAGQKAAIQAAKMDKRVVVVEKDPAPGGACLYSGTIPSKSLREAILDLTGFYEHSFYGQVSERREVTIQNLNFRLQKVIHQERELITRQFRKNAIHLIHGIASFEDAQNITVINMANDVIAKIRAEKIILATGSKPRNPTHIPFDNDVILDSTRLLAINRLPKSLLVLGGGIIGSEYASFFAALGDTEVTVIDKKDRMLPLLDDEISIHLQTALANLGLKFYGGKELVEILRIQDHAVVRFKDGSEMRADMLLYALGRTANVDGLCIEKAGISVNPKGYIPVNALFQTLQPHIYAVGDLIGGPCLAATSMEQGRLAARHAFGAETHYFPSVYPIGIYTIPEISSCGYTEEALKDLGYHYEVGRAYYYEIARSHIAGSNVGLVKILFHAETLELLGVHVIGHGATEVIHIGQIAMSMHSHLDYFVNHIFNYPTYAEGFRIAALNGMNKVRRRRGPIISA